MSQALSHLSLFLPLASSGGKSHNFLKPQSFLKPVNNGSLSHKKNRVIAMAMPGETRHNLDHLQKAPKHPPPPPPKKRTAPTPPIGLWDRFPTARTVQQMMEAMERMMEDPLEYAGKWPSPRSIGPYGRGRTPWEIKEGKKEYKMRFDMPGMTKEDVRVWVEEKMLVLKAEKEEEQEEEEEENGEEWSAKSYGKYSYRIALPENVQFEKIKAEVKDGVLYITIPKADKTSKILDINVK